MYENTSVKIAKSKHFQVKKNKKTGKKNVVFKKKGPSVLKFYANWCGGCQASHEHFLALADKGYCVWAVDVDILSDLSNDLLIEAIPTVFFVDSKGKLHPYQDSFEINKLEESFEAFMLAELIED
jgi:thiol-disulfide isomerase/thioredoxin